MRRPARFPLPLVLASGACLGLLAGGGIALAGPSGIGAAAAGSPQQGELQAPSTSAQIALAEHLRTRGVVFYGAYWCPHCHHQKLLFGPQAAERLPYVECARDEAGAKACSAAGVEAFPTWVMGRDRRVGFQTLEELAIWTLYPKPEEFTQPAIPSVPQAGAPKAP
jgi:hypothetical protein